MGVGFVRIWCCAAVLALLLAASFAAAATGNSDFTSGEAAITITKMAAGRRLLGVHLNDYGEPSANRGHDPRGKGAPKPAKKKKRRRSS